MTIFPNIGLQGQYGSSSGGSISSGSSYGMNTSAGESWGSGWGYENGYSHSAQQASSEWGGYANGESYGQTFGREASAQDVQNAYTANAIERELWGLQATYNAQEAEKNRIYQTYMSNTAYERATKDLIRAGLNPILAVGAAASSPVGATASSGLSSAHKANAYAEQRSYSRNESREWGSSRSNSYSESKHEAKSQNSNYSHNSSYGYNTGQNSARSWENANYSNNVKSITENAIATVGGMQKTASSLLAKGIQYATNTRKGGTNTTNSRAGKY